MALEESNPLLVAHVCTCVPRVVHDVLDVVVERSWRRRSVAKASTLFAPVDTTSKAQRLRIAKYVNMFIWKIKKSVKKYSY
jgi:hypothetical protein